MPKSIVKIEGAKQAYTNQIVVFFQVKVGDDYSVGGQTTVTTDFDRVRVETAIEGTSIESNKLDPNEADNDFFVIAAELWAIEPFTMPLHVTNLYAIGSIVHAYVSGGRPAWS